MNKRGVSLILLILALAILFFIIVAVMSYFFFSAVMSYFFFSKTEKSIETNQNIEKIKIDDNYAKIKVSAEDNYNEIALVDFVFTDTSGKKYYYSTDEGIEEISFYRESYEYAIPADSIGLNDFSKIYRIEASFEYKEESSYNNEYSDLENSNSNTFSVNSLSKAYWRYNNLQVNELNNFSYGNALTLMIENSEILKDSIVSFLIYEKNFTGNDSLVKLNIKANLNGFASIVWIINKEDVENAQKWINGNKLQLYFVANGVKSNILEISFIEGIPNVENNSLLENPCFNGVKDGNETGIDCGGECGNCECSQSKEIECYVFAVMFLLEVENKLEIVLMVLILDGVNVLLLVVMLDIIKVQMN